MSKQIVVVKNTGWVNWAAPIIIKSHCTIDVTSFPFDTQMCKLKFGPWQYNGKDVVLRGEGTTIHFFLLPLHAPPLYILPSLFSSSLLLYALNSAADKYVPYMEKKVCVIYYNGLVNWAAPVIMKSHCKIDVTNFPFDEQYCKLKFGPWQYSGNETVLFGTGMSPQSRCYHKLKLKFLQCSDNKPVVIGTRMQQNESMPRCALVHIQIQTTLYETCLISITGVDTTS